MVCYQLCRSMYIQRLPCKGSKCGGWGGGGWRLARPMAHYVAPVCPSAKMAAVRTEYAARRFSLLTAPSPWGGDRWTTAVDRAWDMPTTAMMTSGCGPEMCRRYWSRRAVSPAEGTGGGELVVCRVRSLAACRTGWVSRLPADVVRCRGWRRTRQPISDSAAREACRLVEAWPAKTSFC